MKNRNTIQDELNGLNSNLPSDPNGTPFSVPEGYFDGLAASILAKVKSEGGNLSASEEIAQISPLLAGISRNTPYSLPENYFQSNIESLPAFTSQTEESLVLSFIEKEMPYEVPSGYFASFPEQVLEKLNTQRGAKVVPLMRRKWTRLAVAAMVTGIITFSGIAIFSNKKSGTVANNVPVAVELKKASTEELHEFIQSTDAGLTENKTPMTASNKAPKKETEKLFKDVSDKELEAFLEGVPTEDDEVEIN